MSGRPVNRAEWAGDAAFRFFREFDKPHYATTVRIDVTPLMERKQEIGVFRFCLWALGHGLHAVPELRLRFRGEDVVAHDTITLSPTIARNDDTFGFTYIAWHPDFAVFDAEARARIAETRGGAAFAPSTDPTTDNAYLSCLPWMDYTALDHAVPGPEDCVPRIAWGKIVPKAGGFDMAVSLQVHHALVHGRNVAQSFAAMQAAFDDLAAG